VGLLAVRGSPGSQAFRKQGSTRVWEILARYWLLAALMLFWFLLAFWYALVRRFLKQ
jgi:hypothetical protein